MVKVIATVENEKGEVVRVTRTAGTEERACQKLNQALGRAKIIHIEVVEEKVDIFSRFNP